MRIGDIGTFLAFVLFAPRIGRLSRHKAFSWAAVALTTAGTAAVGPALIPGGVGEDGHHTSSIVTAIGGAVLLFCLWASVQPDGNHAHAHVRRAVPASRQQPRACSSSPRWRRRSALSPPHCCPRIAGMRAPELSPVAKPERAVAKGCTTHSVEAHRDRCYCRLAVQLLRRVPLGHGIRQAPSIASRPPASWAS